MHAAPAVAPSTDASAGDPWLIRMAHYLWATSLDGNARVKSFK